MAMFEKAEDEYNGLMSKKNIIEVSCCLYARLFFCFGFLLTLIFWSWPWQNDKSKIKKVIEELDEKKKETLKVTWVKVNK